MMPQNQAALYRRWWHASVLATAMAAMVLLGEAALVDARPFEVGPSAAAANDGPIECTDDTDFRFNDHQKKDCVWIGKKKTEKRCGKKSKGQSQEVRTRCRLTCNYQGCADETPDESPDESPDERPSKLTVGAYYYPWWGNDFHGKGYLREFLDPPQIPLLGEYNDSEPDVIDKHLQWSFKYNINLWVASWWGKDRREDTTIKEVILKHENIGDHKLAIFYESTGRLLGNDRTTGEPKPITNAYDDLYYLCQEYFDHQNYYRVGVDENGEADAGSSTTRPVIFVYLTRKLEREGMLPEVLGLMRSGARDAGCGEIFIVGDQVFRGPPELTEEKLIPFQQLDAVTNYDVYGSMKGDQLENGYVGNRAKVAEYYQEQADWRDLAHENKCSYIPAVSPGFNDRGVRLEVDRKPLSRRLNSTAAEGSLFEAALLEARKIVDPAISNLIMVNSFNEHHEDTQIEPVLRLEDRANGESTSTTLPSDRTKGLEYPAYFKVYLNLLRDLTKTYVVPPPPPPEGSSEAASSEGSSEAVSSEGSSETASSEGSSETASSEGSSEAASSDTSLTTPSENVEVLSASIKSMFDWGVDEEDMLTISDMDWDVE